MAAISDIGSWPLFIAVIWSNQSAMRRMDAISVIPDPERLRVFPGGLHIHRSASEPVRVEKVKIIPVHGKRNESFFQRKLDDILIG